MGGWALRRLRDAGAVEAAQPRCCEWHNAVMANGGWRGGGGWRDAWKVMVLGLGKHNSFFYSI